MPPPSAQAQVQALLEAKLREGPLTADEQAAYDRVAEILRTTVRASSAVESVLRMQQGRHRKMTPAALWTRVNSKVAAMPQRTSSIGGGFELGLGSSDLGTLEAVIWTLAPIDRSSIEPFASNTSWLIVLLREPRATFLLGHFR